MILLTLNLLTAGSPVSEAIQIARTSARGGFNLFWGVAASSIITAIGVVVIARVLSPAEYGLVTIVLIAPTMMDLIRDLGIDQATIKYTAQYNQENKPQEIKTILEAATTFELVLGILMSLILFLLSGFLATNIFNRPDLTSLIQLASLTVLGGALFRAAQSAFTGYERMELHSVILIIRAILKGGFMIFFILLGLGVYGAILGTTVAYLISGVVSAILLYITVYKKLGKNNGKTKIFTSIKNMLKYGLPLSLAIILTGFLPQFYGFLVAIYLSDLIIGNYQAAINFAVIATFFVTPVQTALFPVFSKLNSTKGPGTLRNVFQASVKYASLLVVPATFMIIALSQPAVFTIFGTKYAYTPLYLSLYLIFYLKTAFGFLSAGNLLKGQEKTQLQLKITILGFITGIILSIILIPQFGILGLIATHITAGLPGLILSLWWIKKHYNITLDYRSSIKILTASAISAAITYLIITQIKLAYWITLILGGAIYLTTYLVAAPLTGAINKKDVKNLKEMLKALGPLALIFNVLLNIIEQLTTRFHKE